MCSIMGYCGEGMDYETFRQGFDRTLSRGPDDTRIVDTGMGLLGFHRLAIMDPRPEGMQPFELEGSFVVCNGEIYGFDALRKKLEGKYTFVSDSDCEVLLPLYREYGTDMFRMLDAEFACILFDAVSGSYVAARDPIGIRPLYYGRDEKGVMVFASEPKNLVGLVDKIAPFPPGHYYKDGVFVRYADMTRVERPVYDDLDTICQNIREKLIAGVEKRLIADAKVGFLLSGGLDSSLVCAIAAKKSSKPIRTFAIGMDTDAIDLKYAREVADYIGSDHTEVIISRDDVIEALEPVVALLAPTTSPPSGPASVCTWCVRLSTSRPTSGCCLPERSPTSCSVISIPTLPLPPRSSSMRRRNASGSCTCTMCSGPTGVSRSTLWRPGCPSVTWTLSAMSWRSTPRKSATTTARANTCCAGPLRGTTCPLTFSTGRRQPSPMQ